jgi:hypothetical protein
MAAGRVIEMILFWLIDLGSSESFVGILKQPGRLIITELVMRQKFVCKNHDKLINYTDLLAAGVVYFYFIIVVGPCGRA